MLSGTLGTGMSQRSSLLWLAPGPCVRTKAMHELATFCNLNLFNSCMWNNERVIAVIIIELNNHYIWTLALEDILWFSKNPRKILTSKIPGFLQVWPELSHLSDPQLQSEHDQLRPRSGSWGTFQVLHHQHCHGNHQLGKIPAQWKKILCTIWDNCWYKFKLCMQCDLLVPRHAISEVLG